MNRFLVFAALALTVLASLARAQNRQVSVQAELAAAEVYVGDSVDFTIQVDGAANPERPKLALPQGLQGEFAGGTDRSSHFVSIINGKRQERANLGYSFQYRLTPMRAGDYIIPPVEVLVDGKAYRTNGVTLTAVPPPQSDAARLIVEAEKTSLYVGEPTRLRITWLIAADVRGLRFSDLAGTDAFDITHPRDRVPTGRQSQDQSVKEIPLFGRNVVATIDNQTVDGRQVMRVILEQIITPKEPGSFELGPLSVAFDQVVGQRQRSVFDFFDDRSLTKRVVSIAEPITIEVRPLPTEGRPAGFGGLVGSYSMKAAAEPTDVGIGDPITLKLTIEGSENLDSIAAPPLESSSGFAGSFKLSPEGWSAAASARGRAFTTTIRATDPSVTAIPSLELPYFDVEAGRYSIARSDAIPLKVRPTRTVTAADAITSGAPLGGAPIASSGALESAAPGLPANYESYDALANEGAGLGARLGSPVVIAVLAAPAGAYMALAFTLAVRRIRHPYRPRLTQAMRRARDHLARADSLPSIAGTLRNYVGEVTNHHATTLTGEDCAALLERSGAVSTARDAGAIISLCDSWRFGGPEPETADLRRRALDTLTAVDRDLRRSA